MLVYFFDHVCSRLSLCTWQIQICTDEHFAFCFWRFILALFDYRTWYLFCPTFDFFCCFEPLFLALHNLLQVLVGSLTHRLFFSTNFCHFLCKFKSIRSHLGQSLLMNLNLLCEFKIVICNSLLKHSWNLLKNLCKVLFKLRSKCVKKLVYFEFNFLFIHLFKILVYFRVDTADHFLKIGYPRL